MRNRLVFLVSALVTAIAISASPARASSIAYSMDNTSGDLLGNGPFTLGSSFLVNTNITTSRIGVFDGSSDGLLESHNAGIFDSLGNLLGSAVIPIGTGGALVNNFRYVPLVVSLLAGQTYYIGAVWNSGLDDMLFPAGFGATPINFATNPALTFLANQFAAGGTLSWPNGSAGTDPAYFGPNFEFNAANVPEPTTLVLLGSGVATLIARRRSRKNS